MNKITSSRKKVLLLAVIGLILSLGGGYYYYQIKHPKSIYALLDYYGFQKPEQKQALEFLMQKSGAIPASETLMTVFPKRKTASSVFEDLLSFLQLTQSNFTIRKGSQERWEVKPKKWMEKDKSDIQNALLQLGLTQEIKPVLYQPDAICVLGASMTSMILRLEYAGALVNENVLKAKNLILLAGERKVSLGVDGTQNELQDIAKKYSLRDLNSLTETHLIQEAYNNSSIFNKIPTEVINTPAGNLPRPTTETTVRELCNWLSAHPTVKSITFISNQPHVKYQEAIIREVFKQQGVNIRFEVIGPKVAETAKIQDIIGALGSQIWAETPNVIEKTQISTNNPDLIDQFMKLYRQQPLIYKNVESLFPTQKAK